MTELQVDVLEKARQLYREAQNDVQKGRLNRITEQRMKKRYLYLDKDIHRREQTNKKSPNLQQLKFYRNKFHSLMALVSESMRESYNKYKFEEEVKNILKDNWSKPNDLPNTKKPTQSKSDKKKPKYTQKKQKNQKQEKNSKWRDIEYEQESQSPPRQKRSDVRRSKSPLQEFFEKSQGKSKNNFEPHIKQSGILQDLRKMRKRKGHDQDQYSKSSNNINIRNGDSRLRDLRRENEELQKILRRRQQEGEKKNSTANLQKQINYFRKVNSQLRYQTQNNSAQESDSAGPYQIPYQKNDVNKIENKNIQYSSSRRWEEALDKNKNRNKSRSLIEGSESSMSSLVQKSRRESERSYSKVSMCSSKVQKEKEVYLNLTPQVLFQNELIKVVIIRYPFKVQENVRSNSSLEEHRENPQLQAKVNEQKLELLVLNNAPQIVKNKELSIGTNYDFDKKCHEILHEKRSLRGYSRTIENSKDIVFSEVVWIKLIDEQGYIQQVHARIEADFFYDGTDTHKLGRMEKVRQKQEDKIEISLKIPVTFIEFSNRPFTNRFSNSKKEKLTIEPNPLYDSFDHTYINTRLPLKSMPFYKSSAKVFRQSAIFYGRSFIHDPTRITKGRYIESDIELVWTEKGTKKYLTINAIPQWVYLLSYLFMDISQEEEEFEKEYRKPSMHVYFNMSHKQYA